MNVGLRELLDYTQEQQEKWERWFAEKGDGPLGIAIGSGRLENVGQVVRHTLGVNLYFAERLAGKPVTRYWEMPLPDTAGLFRFGTQAKQALREFILTNPDWNAIVDLQAPGISVRPTVRTAVLNAIVHEIRHWAQISALMRQHGFEPPPDQDVILSKVFDAHE